MPKVGIAPRTYDFCSHHPMAKIHFFDYVIFINRLKE
jgi:hypothetical protein